MFSRSSEERLKRLARSLDELAERDRKRIRHEEEMLLLRQAAGAELHRLCQDFVNQVNELVTAVKLDLSPPVWAPETLSYHQPNLFQINVNGRMIQLTFQVTDHLEEQVEIRAPYTLTGAVRWFNQELLDREEVHEDRLYYCIGRTVKGWRYIDSRSQKMGIVNLDYLIGLLEQLVE
jgi:hypothetical protein